MENLELQIAEINDKISKIFAVILSIQDGKLPQTIRELLASNSTVDLGKLESIEVEHDIRDILKSIKNIEEYLQQCHIANRIINREEKFQRLKNMVRTILDKCF